MSMTARLHSVNGLAIEIGRDRRTVAKALVGRVPDGQVNGRPGWLIRTALDALEQHDRPRRVERSGDEVPLGEEQLRKIETAAKLLESLLGRLSLEPDLELRRAIVGRHGHVVGDLNMLMEQANSTAAAASRPLLEWVREAVIGEAIAEIITACEWDSMVVDRLNA